MPKAKVKVSRKQTKVDTKPLIAAGKKQGFVTQDDILDLFPRAENHLLELDGLYNQLYKLGVDVFESISEEETDEEKETSDLEKELEVLG